MERIKIFLSVLANRWKQLSLASKLLGLIEPLGFAIGVALYHYGWMYFVGTSVVVLLGAWVGQLENNDRGRTIFELYIIDLGLHILGLTHYLIRYYVASDFPDWAASNGELIYNSLNVGLSLAKILAIASVISVPGQAGWPRLLPWNRLRDIPGSQNGDGIVYLALIGCFCYGFWFQLQGYGHAINMAVWATPALLVLVVDIARSVGMTHVSELSGRTQEFAARYEAMTPEEQELAEKMIDAVRDAKREIESTTK